MTFPQDILTRLINLQWGEACRFAVCGYDGNWEGEGSLGTPVFFGVGAYSDDGKAWTPFTAFDSGTMIIVFNMHTSDTKLVIAGGNINTETGGGFSTCTATLK